MADIVNEIACEKERIGENGYSNVGMVVGGLGAEDAAALRSKYDKLWFLVPGFGSQGASATDCVKLCKTDGTGALINASRSIIYAYEKPKYKEQFGNDWKKCIEQAVTDAKVELSNAMATLL
jgi:orotidine-5'-phosphate decarboxylase